MGPRTSSPSDPTPAKDDDLESSREPFPLFPQSPLLCLSGQRDSSIPCHNALSLSLDFTLHPSSIVLAFAAVDSRDPGCIGPIVATTIPEAPTSSVNTEKQVLLVAHSDTIHIVNPFAKSSDFSDATLSMRPPPTPNSYSTYSHPPIVAMEIVPTSRHSDDPLLLASADYSLGVLSLARREQVSFKLGFPFGIFEHVRSLRLLKRSPIGFMGGLSEDGGGGQSWFEPELVSFDLERMSLVRKRRFRGFGRFGYSNMDVCIPEDDEKLVFAAGRWGLRVWRGFDDDFERIKEDTQSNDLVDQNACDALIYVPERRLLMGGFTGRRRTVKQWDIRRLDAPLNEFLIEAAPEGYSNSLLQLCRSAGDDRFAAVSKKSLWLFDSFGRRLEHKALDSPCTGCCLFPAEEDGEIDLANAVDLGERLEFVLRRTAGLARILLQSGKTQIRYFAFLLTD